MIQKQLFLAFFRSGLVGFGGGPATIPLIKKEVVENYQFLTDDEFYEIMAIGNTLPGPIVTKLAGYIGYRVGGMLGLVNAILAAIIPSIIMMIVLIQLLFQLDQQAFVKGMLNGVMPIIGVMMFIVFIECLQKTKKSMGIVKMMLIIIVAFFTILILHIDPVLVVLIAILFALFLPVKGGSAK